MGTQSVSSNAVTYRQSLPYTEPILEPNVAAQTARAQARSAQYHKTNIVQRMLVQLTDWVKSRVATFRISSALAPFVRMVTGKALGTVTKYQVEALNNALAFAASVKNGSDKVVSVAVSQALGTLDRREKAALRKQLLEETGLSEHVRDSLLYEVTASLQESISADADFYVMAALDAIATIVQVPALAGENGSQYSRIFWEQLKLDPTAVARRLVSQAGPYLSQHLQLVSPGTQSVSEGSGLLSPERQVGCLSASTRSKVQSWFLAQPAGLQKKVAAAITACVNDRTAPVESTLESANRAHAFCAWLQQALAKDPVS